MAEGSVAGVPAPGFRESPERGFPDSGPLDIWVSNQGLVGDGPEREEAAETRSLDAAVAGSTDAASHQPPTETTLQTAVESGQSESHVLFGGPVGQQSPETTLHTTFESAKDEGQDLHKDEVSHHSPETTAPSSRADNSPPKSSGQTTDDMDQSMSSISEGDAPRNGPVNPIQDSHDKELALQNMFVPEFSFLNDPPSWQDPGEGSLDPVPDSDGPSSLQKIPAPECPILGESLPLQNFDENALNPPVPSQEDMSLGTQTHSSPENAPNPEPVDSGIGNVEYDHDGGSSGILRLRPTTTQWEDFPAILAVARRLGAERDGCFKVVLPHDFLGPMPAKPAQRVAANAYKPHLNSHTRIWKVHTIPAEGNFPSSSEDSGSKSLGSTEQEIENLRRQFTKSDKANRQMRHVRYRVDVPAWTADQRRAAGVPENSPFHPLKGDKLDRTKAIIPGIHTPYVYESGPAFGATFQIHAEDFRLSSLNHLYKGRKIWIVIPSGDVDVAEQGFKRLGKCSQFMRHRAEFVFPSKLQNLKVPYRIIDQRPGETIVILPDAYHEGFSTGYTLAEAKNYAESNWTAATYQPCDSSCNLPTAIPAKYMELIGHGEERLDLCALQDSELEVQRKRRREEEEQQHNGEAIEPEAQRPKLSAV